jgi:hypothetical protein
MEVHVFVFEYPSGRDISVHASAELAYAAAAKIARRDWTEARRRDPTLPAEPPPTDVEAVEMYFEAQRDFEYYEIAGCRVEGAEAAIALAPGS